VIAITDGVPVAIVEPVRLVAVLMGVRVPEVSLLT